MAITVTNESIDAAANDRFHRFSLIGWWNQQKLRDAKVLVVGAGALGNEILKNLALLGIGNVLVADLDKIENSNLSRSVLYRKENNGQYKATVAAQAARDIYPDQITHAFNGNIVYDLGVGAYHWADVVIGGLDNREARLSINRNCYRTNTPWIDGAIQQIDGVARVFVPDTHPQGTENSACYECTMSETDWKLLSLRRSCNLLSKNEMEAGKTPTTPTISSIIAAVQCQEAVKLIHGLPTLAGQGWVFNGLSAEAYTTAYQRKESCFSHDPLESIVPMDWQAGVTTVATALAEVKARLGPKAELELPRDVLHKLVCPKCGDEQAMFCSLGKVPNDAAKCPHCPGVRREVVTFFKIRGDEPFLDRTLAGIGVPAFDVLIARTAERAIGLELSGDGKLVLGPLPIGAKKDISVDAEGLDWE